MHNNKHVKPLKVFLAYYVPHNVGWYARFTVVSTLCASLLILHSLQNSKASRSAVPSPITTMTPVTPQRYENHPAVLEKSSKISNKT